MRARSLQRFENGEIDAVYIINNEFKSVMSQNLTCSKILPVELPRERRTGRLHLRAAAAELLMASLLPRYVEVQVYTAMLESTAAEHAARMTAMDAASSERRRRDRHADA